MFELPMQWTSPNIILFGRDSSGQAARQAARLCKRVLLVSGSRALRDNGALDKLESGLRAADVDVIHYAGIASEPTVADVDKGAAMAKDGGCDGVFAVGGGSVLDTGKAISGMMTNVGSVRDYIPGVGGGKALLNAPAPLIALPTTAGTGSETTNNAVILDREQNWKRSIRDERLMARVAVVDPLLQMGLSAKSTAAAGMDAICQLIEAYMNDGCSALTAAVVMEGLSKCASLPGACEDVLEAREAMAYAAMLSGFAITQAGVGAAHGIATGLGSALGMGHGLSCAVLLPYIVEIDARTRPEKCAAVAEAFLGRTFAKDAGRAMSDAIKALNAKLGIPLTLKGLARKEDIERIFAGTNPATVNKGPTKLTEAEWKALIASLIE